MRRHVKLVLFALLLLLSGSCGKDHEFDCLKGTGRETSERRALTGFSRLQVDDNIRLELFPDTNWFVEVTAGENIIGGIVTELQGNTLYLRNDNRCNWVRNFRKPVTVRVGMPEVELISYYGYETVVCKDTIRTNDFTFDCWNGSGSIHLLLNTYRSYLRIHNGRADLQAAGRSDVSFVYLNDVAIMDNSRLSTDLCYLRNKSTGDCRVRVEKELEAEVEHTGDVIYSGNPYRVKAVESGTGRVVRE